jgi:hypothetical protein
MSKFLDVLSSLLNSTKVRSSPIFLAATEKLSENLRANDNARNTNCIENCGEPQKHPSRITFPVQLLKGLFGGGRGPQPREKRGT